MSPLTERDRFVEKWQSEQERALSQLGVISGVSVSVAILIAARWLSFTRYYTLVGIALGIIAVGFASVLILEPLRRDLRKVTLACQLIYHAGFARILYHTIDPNLLLIGTAMFGVNLITLLLFPYRERALIFTAAVYATSSWFAMGDRPGALAWNMINVLGILSIVMFRIAERKWTRLRGRYLFETKAKK